MNHRLSSDRPWQPLLAAGTTERPQTMRGRHRHVPLAQWLTGGFVLATLVAVAIPASSQTAHSDARARALAQAKQIGLALTLFAGDNDGVYPMSGVPEKLHAPANSNAAFAVLLPTYTTSERIFGNPLSAYQTHPPDDKIDVPYTGSPSKTLEPGENVYAYVMGLTDANDPACPLIADGTDGTGHYVADPAKRGGVWSGEEAIVVRLDNSGRLEKLVGPADARHLPRGSLSQIAGGKPDDNLLDVSRLGKNVRLLDPAVGVSVAGGGQIP